MNLKHRILQKLGDKYQKILHSIFLEEKWKFSNREDKFRPNSANIYGIRKTESRSKRFQRFSKH